MRMSTFYILYRRADGHIDQKKHEDENIEAARSYCEDNYTFEILAIQRSHKFGSRAINKYILNPQFAKETSQA